MSPIVPFKRIIALIPLLAIMGSFFVVPYSARADENKDGKKGDITIKVGEPIIIKDKNKKPQTPPPKKKDQEQSGQ